MKKETSSKENACMIVQSYVVWWWRWKNLVHVKKETSSKEDGFAYPTVQHIHSFQNYW